MARRRLRCRRKPASGKQLTRRGGDGCFLLVGLEVFDPAQGVEVGEAIDEEDPVEMIELMLEGARGERARLDAHLLAPAVATFHDHRLVARHLADPSWVAQAAFVSDLHAVVLDDLRIHERPDLVVVALDNANAQRHSNLRRCQAGSRRREHRLHQVVDQTLDGRVDARHLLRLLAKHGLIKVQDRSDRHEPDSTQRASELSQPTVSSHDLAAHQVTGSTSKLHPLPRGARWRARSRPSPFSVTCQRYSPRSRWMNAGDGPITRMPSMPSFSSPLAMESAASRASPAARASSASVRVRTARSANGGKRNASQISKYASGPRATSLSRRSTLARGHSFFTIDSSRCVPMPKPRMWRLPQ